MILIILLLEVVCDVTVDVPHFLSNLFINVLNVTQINLTDWATSGRLWFGCLENAGLAWVVSSMNVLR